MRVYSVMPNYQAKSIKKNDRVESSNQTMPVAMSVPPPRISGIHLTFTGKDKNIRQFASYAPENKRYGINLTVLAKIKGVDCVKLRPNCLIFSNIKKLLSE